MSLFVDGPACTIEDLVAQDSGLLDVAQNEGIDLTTKIQLAMDDIIPQIQVWIDRPRSSAYIPWRPVIRIEQLVVTPSIKRWQVMTALSMIYRDAYFSQLVDRFKAKWDEYSRLSKIAREDFIAAGLAMVSNPVARAAIPTVGSVPGSLAGGTFYAAVSYLNVNGQEGAASEAASMTVSDDFVMTVMPVAPVNSWNIYAGTSLSSMFLQNQEPLGLGDLWTFVPGAVQSGTLPCKGQMPEFVLPLARTWLRG